MGSLYHYVQNKMFSTANGICQWCQPGGPHSAEEVAASVAGFVVGAVGCDGSDGGCCRHAPAGPAGRPAPRG